MPLEIGSLPDIYKENDKHALANKMSTKSKPTLINSLSLASDVYIQMLPETKGCSM